MCKDKERRRSRRTKNCYCSADGDYVLAVEMEAAEHALRFVFTVVHVIVIGSVRKPWRFAFEMYTGERANIRTIYDGKDKTQKELNIRHVCFSGRY